MLDKVLLSFPSSPQFAKHIQSERSSHFPSFSGSHESGFLAKATEPMTQVFSWLTDKSTNERPENILWKYIPTNSIRDTVFQSGINNSQIS